jgi:hypothetical protein
MSCLLLSSSSNSDQIRAHDVDPRLSYPICLRYLLGRSRLNPLAVQAIDIAR